MAMTPLAIREVPNSIPDEHEIPGSIPDECEIPGSIPDESLQRANDNECIARLNRMPNFTV